MTSERKYELMVRKSIEVQKERVHFDREVSEGQWKPSIEQLQEMTRGTFIDNFLALSEDVKMFVSNKRTETNKYLDNVSKLCFKQLWLAFYMFKGFNKVWNGTEWVLQA